MSDKLSFASGREVPRVAKLSIAIFTMISAMALAAPARAVWPDDVSIVEWYASSLADIVQKAKQAGDARKMLMQG